MLRDKAFLAAWRKLFVYNILFEDAEVDETYLGLDEDSTVLSISAAGCGVAGMVSKRVRSIDACDINGNHLALAALKTTAAQHMFPYTTFYDFCGRGWAAQPKKVLAQIQDELPPFARKYWKRHADFFERSLYRQGLTARLMMVLRKLTGIDESWLRWLGTLEEADRVQAIDDWIAPTLHSKGIHVLANSPVQLLALGINYTQRDRLLAQEGLSMVDFFVEHLKRVARTDVNRNWVGWQMVAGNFNHELPDAVPPYLRPDRWEASHGAPTETRWHHGNIFDVMGAAGPETWSHYTLCDAPDWLPPNLQAQLLGEILRTAREGAIVLTRSVEEGDMVEAVGMTDKFKRLDHSDLATEQDRTRQYRTVNFYEVQA